MQKPPPITSSRWGARTKRIVVTVSLVLVGFLVWNILDILPLVVGSMLLSYLLWPLVNFIERRVLGFLPFRARSLAVAMSFVCVLALMGCVVVLIVPVLARQIADVGDDLPRVIATTEAEIVELLRQPLTINGTPITLGGEPIILLDEIQEGSEEADLTTDGVQSFDIFSVLRAFLGSLGDLTGPAFSVLGGAVDAVINITFLLVIMFYFMRDGERFLDYIISLTPESYEGDVRRMLYELSLVWDAYLRGQIILSVIVGMAVYTAALIVGLPNAPIFGLLSGLLEFIPNLGPFIAMVPAATVALFSQSSTLPFLEGPTFALAVIVIWIIIQNLEAIFLVPRVMGGSLNLHPVVVILAVLAGASAAGAIGIILAAPFAATFRLFGQYIYGKIFDLDPFPATTARHASDVPADVSRFRLRLRLLNPFSRRRRDRDRLSVNISEEI